MSGLVNKIGDSLIENLHMEKITEKKIIKEKIKYNLYCIIFALIVMLASIFISCAPEIIPFPFDLITFIGSFLILTILKVFCALYYIDKL